MFTLYLLERRVFVLFVFFALSGAEGWRRGCMKTCGQQTRWIAAYVCRQETMFVVLTPMGT